MHNIKEGHDLKASMSDTFMNYAKSFKKTKISQEKKEKQKIIFANSKCRQKTITRFHNICLPIHFNGRCTQAIQLLKPIISNLSGWF